MTTTEGAQAQMPADDRLILALFERLERALLQVATLKSENATLKEKQGVISYGDKIRVTVNGKDLGRGEMVVSGGSEETVFAFKLADHFDPQRHGMSY